MKNRKILIISIALITLIAGLIIFFIIVDQTDRQVQPNASTPLNSEIPDRTSDVSSDDLQPSSIQIYQSAQKLKQMQDEAGSEPVAIINGENILASEVALVKWRYQETDQPIPSDQEIIHELALEKIVSLSIKDAKIDLSSESKELIEQNIRDNYERYPEQNEAYADAMGLTTEQAIQQTIEMDIASELVSLWSEEVMKQLSSGELVVPTEEFSLAYNDFQEVLSETRSGATEPYNMMEGADKIGVMYNLYIEYLLDKSDFVILS